MVDDADRGNSVVLTTNRILLSAFPGGAVTGDAVRGRADDGPVYPVRTTLDEVSRERCGAGTLGFETIGDGTLSTSRGGTAPAEAIGLGAVIGGGTLAGPSRLRLFASGGGP